jgi:hypothetical protein
VDRVRDLVAAAWGMRRGDIGLVSSVAEGVSLLVESLDWREGDNVVVDRTSTRPWSHRSPCSNTAGSRCEPRPRAIPQRWPQLATRARE